MQSGRPSYRFHAETLALLPEQAVQRCPGLFRTDRTPLAKDRRPSTTVTRSDVGENKVRTDGTGISWTRTETRAVELAQQQRSSDRTGLKRTTVSRS